MSTEATTWIFVSFVIIGSVMIFASVDQPEDDPIVGCVVSAACKAALMHKSDDENYRKIDSWAAQDAR